MPYALEMHFDPVSDRKIRDLWQSLSDQCGQDYLIKSNFPPHMTLALYHDQLNIDKIRLLTRQLQANFQPLPISFHSFGWFKGDRDVSFFLNPAVSSSLLDYHQYVHEILHAFSPHLLVPYYNPGLWVPHCTVTMQTRPEQAGRCMAALAKFPLPFETILTKIEMEYFEY